MPSLLPEMLPSSRLDRITTSRLASSTSSRRSPTPAPCSTAWARTTRRNSGLSRPSSGPRPASAIEPGRPRQTITRPTDKTPAENKKRTITTETFDRHGNGTVRAGAGAGTGEPVEEIVPEAAAQAFDHPIKLHATLGPDVIGHVSVPREAILHFLGVDQAGDLAVAAN